MKQDSASPRRRVPKFTPVPLRYRQGGWTPMRQADFPGRRAETWCIAVATLLIESRC